MDERQLPLAPLAGRVEREREEQRRGTFGVARELADAGRQRRQQSLRLQHVLGTGIADQAGDRRGREHDRALQQAGELRGRSGLRLDAAEQRSALLVHALAHDLELRRVEGRVDLADALHQRRVRGEGALHARGEQQVRHLLRVRVHEARADAQRPDLDQGAAQAVAVARELDRRGVRERLALA